MDGHILCSDCDSYHRGRGDKKCLSCEYWKTWDKEHQLTSDISLTYLPGETLENIGSTPKAERAMEALQKLPAEYTAVLSMTYFGKMRQDEIAKVLKISERMVRYRLSKGIKLAKQLIK